MSVHRSIVALLTVFLLSVSGCAGNGAAPGKTGGSKKPAETQEPQSEALMLLEQGTSFYKSGDHPKALEIWNALALKEPGRPEVYYNRALSLHALGEYGKAVEDYNKALELDPGFAIALYNRGLSQGAQGDYAAAIADYERAIIIDPAASGPFYQLAWTLVFAPDPALRDGNRAVKMAGHALNITKDMPTLEVLAAAHAEAGDFPSAVAAQERALAYLRQTDPGADMTSRLMRLEYYRAGHKLMEDSVEFAKPAPGGKPMEEDIAPAALPPRPPGAQETAQAPAPTQGAGSYGNQPAAAPKPEEPLAGSPAPEKPPEASAPAAPAATPPPPAEPPPPASAASAGPVEDILYATAWQAQDTAYPYTVQAGSFQSRDEAVKLARTLVSQGEAAFTARVEIPGKGTWHRVFFGAYPSRKTADKARQSMAARGFGAAVTGKNPYAVEVSPANGQTLQDIETALIQKGHVPYSMYYKTGNRTRLLIGAYSGEKDAAAARDALALEGFTAKTTLR
jgi:tetratricopeptide (TPR) repeat protein